MPVDKRNIILVGMPAAGKSTLGVLLAKQLRYNFADSDIAIQVENDGTLAELIAAHGNDALLAMEAKVLGEIQPTRTVLATAAPSTAPMRWRTSRRPARWCTCAWPMTRSPAGWATWWRAAW